MPKTEWQAQDSGYSPAVEGPHNGCSQSHYFVPLCLPQRCWDSGFFPALRLSALLATCSASQVSFSLIGPGSQGSAFQWSFGTVLQCKQCLKKKVGIGRQVAFSLARTLPASVKVPQKAIPLFKTKGKSHMLYRPELEQWILSHMQIILSPGIRNTSKHISVNTL